MAEDVEVFMNTHNLKKVTLIGHSMSVYTTPILSDADSPH
jgi:hypothetical protein